MTTTNGPTGGCPESDNTQQVHRYGNAAINTAIFGITATAASKNSLSCELTAIGTHTLRTI